MEKLQEEGGIAERWSKTQPVSAYAKNFEKKLEKMQKEAAAKGETIDPKLVVEVKEMEKNMRKTGNSFLSGKSKLTAKGGDSSGSSDEEGKSNRSKFQERKSLIEQQSNVKSTIARSNFGMSGMSDHPSASDEETRRPPAKLGDRCKVDGEPWEILKKEAMKEKYK